MSPKMRYEDFEVEIRSIASRKYEVRVLKSPLGRAGSKFVFPYPVNELDGILSALEGRVCASARAPRDLAWEDQSSEPLAPEDVEKLGRELFRALIRDDVEKRFRESLAVVRERGGEQRHRGLRLRVTFDRAEDFSSLATLPWEFLWDQGRFVNRDRLTPVVRSLNVPPSPKPMASEQLRVLLVASNPSDLTHLETGYEAKLVRRALKGNPRVQVVAMLRPNIRKLRSRLLSETFHVVHFMGHGGVLGDGRGNFVLYFEGKYRRAEPVTGMQFAECLQDIRGLRLVVLNSCWSGAFHRHGGRDPFTGVAASLVARGMPTVVAMQFPVSDDAAIAFSTTFYERLSAGDPTTTAVTEGRLAILAAEPDSLEWATPVVFLTGEDRGFPIRKVSRPQGGDAHPARTIETEHHPHGGGPVRLAIRSFRGAYVADAEKPDDLLDLTPFFKGRYIKHVSLWRKEVYPRLYEFLRRHERQRRPLVLDFAAHMTISFAAGYCLDAKSGLDVTLLQRGMSGVQRWQAKAGPAREGRLWQDEPDLVLDRAKSAVAVAISATHSIVADVDHYLKRSRKAMRRLAPMTVFPKPSGTAVEDGLHALQLAQDLSVRIRARSAEERRKPLHLFAAAPNALLFFLGQLARSFGEVQLYEHDFESKKPGAYMPSLRLPVPTDP